jgi:hypothetical protein
MRKIVLLALRGLVLIAVTSSGQPVPVESPFHVRLLPGYQEVTGRSLDSVTGRIWKQGGLSILFDIAGVYTDCKSCGWTEGELWRKKQIVNGQEAVFVFTKARRLVVSFPESHTNFYATIRDQSDMADMLLMLSTLEISTNSSGK